MKKMPLIMVFVSVLVVGLSSANARGKLTEKEKLEKGWIINSLSYGRDETIAVLNVKALINSSPGRVWDLLVSVDRWGSWMPMMRKGWALDQGTLSKILPLPKKTEEIYSIVSASSPSKPQIDGNGVTSVSTFEEFDFPWPINNDWVLRRYKFDASRAGDERYEVAWKQLFIDTEGRGGRWRLSRYDGQNNETLFEYHFRVKCKEGVPKKLFEIVVGKTVQRFVEAIRENVGGLGFDQKDINQKT